MNIINVAQLPPVSSSNGSGTTNNEIGGPGSGCGGGGAGGASGLPCNNSTGTILRQPPLLPATTQQQQHSQGTQGITLGSHYFRPIQHVPYSASSIPHRSRDDFDLTSDSDGISSPNSSIMGPTLSGVGRPPSPHHMNPLFPCYTNGNPLITPNELPNPPGPSYSCVL